MYIKPRKKRKVREIAKKFIQNYFFNGLSSKFKIPDLSHLPSCLFHFIKRLFPKKTLSVTKFLFNALKIITIIIVILFAWNIDGILKSETYLNKKFYNGNKRGFDTISQDQALKDLIKYTTYSKLFLKPLPTINIDIKQKSLIEISAARDGVLARAKRFKYGSVNMRGNEKKWYSASIRANDEKYKVKLRIKGDLTDHIGHKDKWSFKFKVKGDKAFYGMRSFSIQHPLTRNWLSEVFVSEIMLKNNILAPKYFFANIILNGKKIGIMNVEPVLGKELLEAQKRKEGTILRMNEDHHWKAWDINSEFKNKYNVLDSDVKSYFKTYDKNIKLSSLDKKADAVSNTNRKAAISLIRGLLLKKNDWRDVFDEDVMATYLSILQLITPGYYHGLEMTNVRFYYNPIIGKIEPISNDNMASLHNLGQQVAPVTHRYAGLFFHDPEFQKVFIQKAYDITYKIAYSDEYDEIYSLINDYYYPILKTEFLYIHPIDIDKFKNRAKFLNSLYAKQLNNSGYVHEITPEKKTEKPTKITTPNEDTLFKIAKPIFEFSAIVKKKMNSLSRRFDSIGKKKEVKAKTPKTKEKAKEDISTVAQSNTTMETDLFGKLDTIVDVFDISEKGYLKINPIIKHKIKITSVVAKDLDSKKEKKLTVYHKLPLKIRKYRHLTDDNSVTLKYKKPPFNNYKIILSAKLDGFNKTYKHRAISNYPAAATKSVVPTTNVWKQLRKYRFLKKNPGNELVIKKGRWKVNDYIIIPRGYTLTISPGTEINFSENGGIISYGAVTAVSDKNHPIIMKSKKGYWKGMMVIYAGQTSQFENVQFSNLSGVTYKDWATTGALAFYKSDVEMKDVTITNNISEDALNIIHSKFTLNNVSIFNTVSDAFDSDFSQGKIIGGTFQNIGKAGGGDGIDFSGSDIYVEGSTFIDVKDKAVSVGERSNLKVHKVSVRDSGYAFVAKDGSTLDVTSSTVDNIAYCDIMAYTKKSEYGFSSAKATDLIALDEEGICAESQKGSYLKLNGKKIRERDIDIDHLYSTTMRKKTK